jgi:CUB/sushi domain-containing protein
MLRHDFAARRLLVIVLALVGASAASCGNLSIPDGALVCGTGHDGGGTACPDGFTCGSDNRCHQKGVTPHDGGNDTKVDHPADVTGGDVASTESGGPSCPALDTPMGGTVAAPDLTPGSTATYSCTIGGKLLGSATRTCQPDGTWDGSAPTCSLTDCGPLVAPMNGSVLAPTSTFGSVATYSCGPGFGPSGSSTRTCQADGWDGMQPTCVVADCPALAGPAGGSVVASTLTFGATATYACSSGYTIAGVATRTCQPDGTWSNAAPTCTIKDCGALTAPMNGAVTTSGGTVYRATGSYTCDAGYTVSGMSAVTCQADGTWSASAPTCVPKDCGALTAPTNGNVATTVTTFGASATYSCSMGYVLGAGGTRLCGADGKWTGTAPTCSIVDCGTLTAPTNGSVSAPKTTYGQVATYSCMTGYGPSGSATRTCQASGAWDGMAPTCVVANCPALSGPAGGTVSAPTLTYGSTATYSCNMGYTMSGMSTRTCQPGGSTMGTWSGTAPTCTIVDCGALTAPTSGTVAAPTTTYGSTAMYSCNTGYGPSGSVSRSCQADGTWSGTAATCTIKNCGVLSGPTNGTVSAPTTTYGAMATYGCNVGYSVVGTATRSCQGDGTWSGAAPSCSPKDCLGLAAPANGSVSAPTTTYGSVATYSCSIGYGASGSSTRTCQADGTWSGTAPTCVIANCPALSSPTGGSVSAPTLTFGSTATYSCMTGYNLTGSMTRACQADGTWSGAAPTCDPKDCGAPGAPTHGTVSAPTTTFMSIATYSCTAGYALSGATTRTCQSDQTWSSTVPMCVSNPVGLACSGCAQMQCMSQISACGANSTCAACVQTDYEGPSCAVNQEFVNACTCALAGTCRDACAPYCPAPPTPGPVSQTCYQCVSTNCAAQTSACALDATCEHCSTTDYTTAACQTNALYEATCACAMTVTACQAACAPYCGGS